MNISFTSSWRKGMSGISVSMNLGRTHYGVKYPFRVQQQGGEVYQIYTRYVTASFNWWRHPRRTGTKEQP